VDHSKFGRRSLVRLCEFKEIDHLVTDSAVEPRWMDLLRSNGVRVHLADVMEGAEPAEPDRGTNGRIAFDAGSGADDNEEPA
jgi:hypothetical protein